MATQSLTKPTLSPSSRRKKPKLRQLPRQWQILQRLENHRYGLSVAEIARSIECEVRTIYRDLEALQEAGFAMVTEQRGKESRWKLYAPRKDMPTLPMTEEELCALYLSRGWMKPLEGTSYYDSICSVFSKIRSMLKPGVLENLESFESNVKVRTRRGRRMDRITPWVNELHLAIEDGERVELTYRSPSRGESTVRKVDPYQVWFHEGERVYLTGFCHLRGELRTFNLARVSKLKALGEGFVREESFDLEAHLGQSFGIMTGEVHDVAVLFSSACRYLVEEQRWHPTQRVEEQPDGSVIVRFSASGLPEIKRWVLGFGAQATVLEPASLREEVAQEIASALASYTSRCQGAQSEE